MNRVVIITAPSTVGLTSAVQKWLNGMDETTEIISASISSDGKTWASQIIFKPAKWPQQSK